MAGDVEKALGDLGFVIMSDVVRSLRQNNRVATGKTITDTEVIVEGDTRVYILAPAYMVALDKGRKPTNATGPFQRNGGLTFKESLRLWMQARDIPEGKISKNGTYGPVLWAIYTKINKKGYFGRPGTLSTPLSNENINKLLDENLGPLANIFTQKVLNELFK